MTVGFAKGRYVARLAKSAADVSACLAFRHQCFFGISGRDEDSFDADWSHMMVEDGAGGPLVCTFRMRTTAAADITSGYASQFYDLARLSQTQGPHIEIGRFCTDPANPDPHIPRVAWGALTQIVDASQAQVLFGCTSFEGTDPTIYGRHWQRLADNHLGPVDLLPGQKSPDTVPFDRVEGLGHRTPMPPLLRTYLAMGGWVSDHAVVDQSMNTMHVLTVVEIAKIPPARVKALRALA